MLGGDESLGGCECCRRGFPLALLNGYRLHGVEPILLCDACCEALLRDVIEDGSPGFVELLMKRVRHGQ